MTDERISDRIHALSREEELLYLSAGDGSGMSEDERTRLAEIQVELDRAYDLLHQRQARRAVGEDPEAAQVRPAEIVEHYQQ